MKVLVTGGSGFVGATLVKDLAAAGHVVRVAAREIREHEVSGITQVRVGDINGDTDWAGALDGIEAVVHLAARAHVTSDSAADPESAFMAANYEGTRRLADVCRGKVRRFVFISSIGVHGSTGGGLPRNEDAAIQPDTPYGRSKALAEAYLAELRARGDLDAVALRPPLVYGSGAPGNLERLCALVRRGTWIPLGSVRNRRNLIGREHLVRAITAVLAAPAVARPAYCVADNEAVSTPDIVRALARGAGKQARLMPVPVGVLRAAGALAGKRRAVEQLVGSLEVDASVFRAEFGDLQPCRTIEGLEKVMANE